MSLITEKIIILMHWIFSIYLFIYDDLYIVATVIIYEFGCIIYEKKWKNFEQIAVHNLFDNLINLL